MDHSHGFPAAVLDRSRRESDFWDCVRSGGGNISGRSMARLTKRSNCAFEIGRANQQHVLAWVSDDEPRMKKRRLTNR